MRLGKYTITVQSLRHKLAELAFGLNSAKYWDRRFASDWETSLGPLQTGIFAAAFCQMNLPMEPESVLDFGAGGGDSVPFLSMRFPRARIAVWDFSAAAREIQRRRYGRFAEVLEESPTGRYGLVYCSNVIEHVRDRAEFTARLVELAARHVILQAPYNERHDDARLITAADPKGEHIWTITEDFQRELSQAFDWQTYLIDAPFAWEGRQIVFFGERKQSAPEPVRLEVLGGAV